jgi:hypothetical protein
VAVAARRGQRTLYDLKVVDLTNSTDRAYWAKLGARLLIRR